MAMELGDELLLESMKRDPRNIYCHIKGCKRFGAFVLIPGNQLLCGDHEMSRVFKESAFIPHDYFQWKDEAEWKELEAEA